MTTKLDPLSILVDYVLDIKPYHTKLYEVSLAYSYEEPINITIVDQHEFDIGINFDYYTDYCIYAGWDIPDWGGFWKPGGVLNEQIVEINIGAQFFSILGNQLDFFADDQIVTGYIPRGVQSVNVSTSTFTMSDPIPWSLNTPVIINSSLGVIPAPLIIGTTYYIIPIGLKSFQLAAAPNTSPITFTLHGAGVITVGLEAYPVNVLGAFPRTFHADDILYDVGSDRTRIYTAESLAGFLGGYIPVYLQSNWDNPNDCFTPTGAPAASDTTVRVTFTEELQTQDVQWDKYQGIYRVDSIDTINDIFVTDQPIFWQTGSVVTLDSTVGVMPERLVNVGNFVIGEQYTIRTIGTTDFTLIGADSNAVGIPFIATGPGAGDGTATIPLSDFTQYYISRPIINAGLFIIGQQYIIQTLGTTDFIAIGVDNSQGTGFTATPGTVFTATGVGTGTGTAILAKSFKLALTYNNALNNISIDIVSVGGNIITIKLFTNVTFIEAVGVGQFPLPLPYGWDQDDWEVWQNNPALWGGTAGPVFIPLVRVNNPPNTFVIPGDWRNYFSEQFTIQYTSPSILLTLFLPNTTWSVANNPTSVTFDGANTIVTIIEPFGTAFNGFPFPYIQLEVHDANLWQTLMIQYPPMRLFGVDNADNNILAETMFTETIQITVDSATTGMPLIGAWDGDGWDFTFGTDGSQGSIWNEDIIAVIPYYRPR